MHADRGRPARRPIVAPAVWRPADVTPAEWTIELSEGDRDEIVAATRRAAAHGATLTTLRPDQFLLPGLEERLGQWVDALASGRGFVLLRRFPVDVLDEAEVELAYVGLGVHLGVPVGQSKAGEILTHIRDERRGVDGPEVRRYRTRQRQDFHTDGADIVGLLCLHRARSGGESRIASSGAVYNEILRLRPDLLEVLYEPIHWDRAGEEAPGELPYFQLAPFSDVGGVPRVFYIGWYIRDAERHAGVPALSRQQLDAMELIESIANDPTFHLEMDFQPGDIQLLNNGRILHAREAYEDDPDPARRRHLLRLWLAAHRFAGVEPGLRTGIGTRRAADARP